MGKSGNPAKRAQQETPAEYDPTPVDEDGVEDFDAFWSEQDRPTKPVKIAGQVIHLPPALPLETEMLLKRLGKRSDDKSVRRLLVTLYGEDRLDQWAKAGKDSDWLQVLLAWTVQRVQGGTMSMAEVAARIAEAEASGEA